MRERERERAQHSGGKRVRMCEEGLRASVTSGVNTEEAASDGGLSGRGRTWS